jgi:cell wall-associated NlpC family hydrolase
MRSGAAHLARRKSVAIAVVALVTGALAVPASADDVSDQQQRVEQIADQLDALENRLGEIDEQHAAALDRLDALAIEIQDAQARVDAEKAQLAVLQSQLTGIAIDKFTSGGTGGLTPLFSSASTFTDDLQRTELSRVALDQGAGTSDEMQALADDLAAETADLQAKQDEQAQLLASLEEQQQQGESLTAELQTAYASAKAELGDLIQQEQERRAAAAVAAAQAKYAAQQAQAAANNRSVAATPAVRGGGATPASGGTSTPVSGGSSSTPAADPTPSAPPPSSMAGVAVAAAQGQLGVPYKFAREDPGVAFDCSGLTKYAWGKAGVSLPHQSAAQYASTPHVSKDEVQPGDLIFYYAPIGHVAIYIGGGMMIHAPASGDVVKVSPVNWGKVVGVSRPG